MLKEFGFGPNFVSRIKLLYLNPKALIRTNSQPSTSFNLYRGTRQGCPLSPILFDIAIEPTTALRSCRDISGTWRNNREHKVSPYADDLLLFISNPIASLPPVLLLLSIFGRLSGNKLNLNKSELFPINSKARSLDLSGFPFRIENRQIFLFGYICDDSTYTLSLFPGIATFSPGILY